MSPAAAITAQGFREPTLSQTAFTYPEEGEGPIDKLLHGGSDLQQIIHQYRHVISQDELVIPGN